MQQPGGGGGGGAQTHYGGGASAAQDMSGGGAGPSSMAAAETGGDQAQLVEAASPISSRPPASAAVNLDELMTLSGAAEDALADRSGGGGGGSGGNRWPRQETLALLKIRSDMDVAFRDATLKGPLWEDVSRKLLELGYKRSAKKCKEKFENVHKYYKRTKEGRAGRQDGKSYKFFSELEALHGTPATAIGIEANVSATPAVHVTSPNPVSIGFGSISNPMPISSYRMTSTIPVMPSQQHQQTQTATATIPAMPSSLPPTTAAPMDINFSSNSSSSSHGTEDDEDDDDDVEGQPTSRKRKRGSASTSTGTSGSGSTRKMMEFFEVLMKQVMQKQESMQQKFLEVIEKREQDRTIREEAWKRQEMARLTREQELMTQERAISASRDAAIVAFLQKITGQTIQLPPPVNVHTAPPPPVPPSVPVATPLSTPPTQQQPTQTYHQTPQVQQRQQQQVRHQTPQNLQVAVAVPEQQVTPLQENIGGSGGGGGSYEPASSSRWPKVEVLALIKLRSGLESRYQEAGPKGPLWEEISAGMGRLGYKRSSKRCKEKWENINKYFKKVKESNKKRPEDAKTCPYFHELDALYRKRIIGGGSSGGGVSSSSLGNQNRIEPVQPQQQQQPNPILDSAAQQSLPVVSQTQGGVVSTDQSQNKIGDHSTNVETSNMGLRTNLFGDAAQKAAKKPEDIVKELMEQHHQQQALQQGSHQQQLVVDDYGRIEEADSDNIMDQEEDMDDEDIDEEDDEEMEEERKMDYKIEYQKQNTTTTGPSSNGGGNGAPSFLAMVQ